MTQQFNGPGGNVSIHQYYMGIINCMPNIVYWIDLDCNLQGCNLKFVNWLGISKMPDFSGTPYETISKKLNWTSKQIETLKLDDMAVLFSGEAKYDIAEDPLPNKEGELIDYLSTRVPLFDVKKNVMGLVVILVDITAQKAMQKQLNLEVTTMQNISIENSARLESPARILIVEDNPLAHTQERLTFEELNCNVDVAETDDAAKALFSPGKYALVLMDIGLGETSGYIITKEFRKLEASTEYHVPIIALTQYISDTVKYDCNDYGMNGVLTKPLAKEQAAQIIKRYIGNENVSVDGLHSM